ncbi:hypothetical protein C2U70_25235 [Bradyrhizobium guangdongense]|nr:hypothetical protein C2U70_25235 [Bradyrhizobium guangdongense]
MEARTMRHAPFVAASFVLRRYRHGRRGLFIAFLESVYRWHQQRVLLDVYDDALPPADTTDQPRRERQRPDIQEVARHWLPH